VQLGRNESTDLVSIRGGVILLDQRHSRLHGALKTTAATVADENAGRELGDP